MYKINTSLYQMYKNFNYKPVLWYHLFPETVYEKLGVVFKLILNSTHRSITLTLQSVA